jgi:hypothetical protein
MLVSGSTRSPFSLVVGRVVELLAVVVIARVAPVLMGPVVDGRKSLVGAVVSVAVAAVIAILIRGLLLGLRDRPGLSLAPEPVARRVRLSMRLEVDVGELHLKARWKAA